MGDSEKDLQCKPARPILEPHQPEQIMSHACYELHPTQEHMVITPDGGVIECKHESAAKRVRDELNEREEAWQYWNAMLSEREAWVRRVFAGPSNPCPPARKPAPATPADHNRKSK